LWPHSIFRALTLQTHVEVPESMIVVLSEADEETRRGRTLSEKHERLVA
jgi:hypothetical protein